MSGEDLVPVIIDKLNYGSQLDRLCSRILRACVVHPTDMVDTAMVRSESTYVAIYYNQEITDEKWLTFLLQHEALHVAFGHIFLDQNEFNPDFLNIALDASINPYILFDVTQFTPVNSPDPNKPTFISGLNDIYDKMTWQFIYNSLSNPDQPPEMESKESDDEIGDDSEDSEDSEDADNNGSDDGSEDTDDNSSDGGDNNESDEGSSGHDSESDTDGDDSDEDDGRGSESPSPDGKDKQGNKEPKRFQLGNHVTPDIHGMSEPPSKAVQSVLEELIITAMNEVDIHPGSITGQYILSGLNYVYTSRQKWRRALSKEVLRATKIRGYESCWKRPNKRFNSSALPLPGKRKLFYPRITVVVDTSGSMCPYIEDVISHVATISSENGIIDRLLAGDVEVRLDLKSVKKSQIKDIQWVGFGGTTLIPMMKRACSTDSDIIIIITDLLLDTSDFEFINTSVGKKHSVILCVPEEYQNNLSYITNRHIRTVIIDDEKKVYTKAS